LIFVHKTTGCKDTLLVKVYCTTIAYRVETIYVAQKDTVCLDINELIGNVKNVKNVCINNAGEHAKFTIIPGTRCITCEGIEAGGVDEACFVIEDDNGMKDTTVFRITVIERADVPVPPVAVADAITTIVNTTVNINVLANDQMKNKLQTIVINAQPANGKAIVLANNTIQYTPNSTYCDSKGGDTFTYTVTDEKGQKSTATVTVKVTCKDVKVYNGFSPNNDGVNDFFFIEGLEGKPNNTVNVYNRWGNQVFSTEDYKNNWNGTFNNSNLPEGTYFYIVKDGEGTVLSGYVQIQR
jgi:gliding motility-associated-like protein